MDSWLDLESGDGHEFLGSDYQVLLVIQALYIGDLVQSSREH